MSKVLLIIENCFTCERGSFNHVSVKDGSSLCWCMEKKKYFTTPDEMFKKCPLEEYTPIPDIWEVLPKLKCITRDQHMLLMWFAIPYYKKTQERWFPKAEDFLNNKKLVFRIPEELLGYFSVLIEGEGEKAIIYRPEGK
jgi:hypothetical protein